MANLTLLIPTILHYECGVEEKYLKLPLPELFSRARVKGFAQVKGDRGGATMCGITLATYTDFCARKGLARPDVAALKAMTCDKWLEIYHTMFWNRAQGDKIFSQGVANMIVDWLWNSGIVALKTVQRLVGVKDDGVIGPKSLAAINATDPGKLFAALKRERLKFVERIVARNPVQAKFLRGWQRRINAVPA